MLIAKSQVIVFFIALTALATVARAGAVIDLMLVAITALMLASGLRITSRMQTVLLAFAALFCVYFFFTMINPSRTGIKNIIGIFIAATFLIYFWHNSQNFVNAPYSAALLFGSGFMIIVLGVGQDVVSKNTVSGIATYFFLSAGVVQVARGAPLFRTLAILAVLLVFVGGVALGHRLMIGAAIVLFGIVFLLRVVPLEATRNLTLVGVFGGIIMIIILFSGFWGFDIREYDSLFVEYTGRTSRSGRQIIWPIIISHTSSSPWIGLGTGTNFSSLYDSPWSAHSYFLQTYMQSGLVGITALVLVFLAIWRAIGRPRSSQPGSFLATGCFFVLIIHASFEVFLMQVNLLMGCSAWMMIGLCIGCIQKTVVSSQPRRDSCAPRSRIQGTYA